MAQTNWSQSWPLGEPYSLRLRSGHREALGVPLESLIDSGNTGPATNETMVAI